LLWIIATVYSGTIVHKNNITVLFIATVSGFNKKRSAETIAASVFQLSMFLQHTYLIEHACVNTILIQQISGSKSCYRNPKKKSLKQQPGTGSVLKQAIKLPVFILMCRLKQQYVDDRLPTPAIKSC